MNKRKEKKKTELKKTNVIKLCMFLAATLEMFWVQPCLYKHLCQQFPKCAASQTTVASEGSHPAAWDFVLPFNLRFQPLLSSANSQPCMGSETAASWMRAGNHWQAGGDPRLRSSSPLPLLALASLHKAMQCTVTSSSLDWAYTHGLSGFYSLSFPQAKYLNFVRHLSLTSIDVRFLFFF